MVTPVYPVVTVFVSLRTVLVSLTSLLQSLLPTGHTLRLYVSLLKPVLTPSGLGGFQEAQQLPFFETITKYQVTVTNNSRMAELTRSLF